MGEGAVNRDAMRIKSMAPHTRFINRRGKGTKTGWLQLLGDEQAMRQTGDEVIRIMKAAGR